MSYDNIKNHKKQGITSSLEKTVLEKPQGGRAVKLTPLPPTPSKG